MAEFNNFFVHLIYRFERRFLGSSSSVSISFPKNSNFLEKKKGEKKNTVCLYTNGHCGRSKQGAGESERCHYKLGKRNVSSAGRRERGKKLQNTKFPGRFWRKKKKKKTKSSEERRMSRAQVGWRDLSQPSIHPSAKPAAASRAAAAGELLPPPRPALPARTAAPPHTQTQPQAHGRAHSRTAAPSHTRTPTPPCARTHTHARRQGRPRGLGRAGARRSPRGSPAWWLRVAVCARPGLPALPAPTSDVTLSRAGDAAAALTRCRGKFPPAFPPPSGALRFGGFIPLPSTQKAGSRRSLLPTLGWGLRCCLPSLPSQLPSFASPSNFPRQPGYMSAGWGKVERLLSQLGESPWAQALPRHLFPAGLRPRLAGCTSSTPQPSPTTCQVSQQGIGADTSPPVSRFHALFPWPSVHFIWDVQRPLIILLMHTHKSSRAAFH